MSDQQSSMSEPQGPQGFMVLPYAPGAIAALVLGIVGTVFAWCYAIGLVPSIVGLVLSTKARKAFAANPRGYQGSGIATAGMVLSIVGVVMSGIAFFVYLGVIMAVIGGLFHLSSLWKH